MSLTRSVLALLLAGAALAACAAPPPDGEALTAEARIMAGAGGTVASADGQVRLTVPADSLAVDTTIAIHEVTELPPGDLGELRPAGPSYRFSPAGTQFSLAEAAGMVMRFDRERLIAEGLDPRTVQLHYLDEDTGRFVAVAGRVDPERDEVFGRTEHFTIYLPLARALLPGNGAPSIALQSTIPGVARAGAPLAVRATVRDTDAGGSVAGVNLTYTVTGGAARTVAMIPDTTVGALDTYQYVIPGTDVMTGPGNDLTYAVAASDNLGAAATSAATAVDVIRTADPTSLAANPPSQVMASGFSRYFTWTMRDDQAASFTVLPDRVEVLGGVGDIVATGSSGVGLRASRAGVGGLRGHVGASIASAQVSVTNGQLAGLQILDSNGMAIDGVVTVRESQRYTFDVVGRDAFGNRVLVSPTWSTDGTIGGIDGEGVLDTLDGVDIGRVKAAVGNLTAVQWVQIAPRTLELLGEPIGARRLSDRRALAVWNGAPLVSLITPPTDVPVASLRGYDAGQFDWLQRLNLNSLSRRSAQAVAGDSSYLANADVFGDLRLYQRRVGWLSYVDVGGFVDRGLQDVSDLSVQVAPDGAPWVAWLGRDPVTFIMRIQVRRWNGVTWVAMGATANEDPLQHAGSCDLAFGADGTAYLAAREAGGTFVKRWAGTDWVRLGASLTAPADGAYDPALELSASGRLYVAYPRTFHGAELPQIRVATWNGTTWADAVPDYQLGDNALAGAGLSLALIGEVPYLGYVHHDLLDSVISVRLIRPHRSRTSWVTREILADALWVPDDVTALDGRADGSLAIGATLFQYVDGDLIETAAYVQVLR